MENNNHLTIKLISLLMLLVVITGVFVIAFTFAGNPEAPDAVATYTRGKLTWTGVNLNGETAELKIFGEPKAGEQYPLISPESDDKYYLRLKNDVAGNIKYSVYLYTESTNTIPLKFDVTMTEEMSVPQVLPAELQGKQIVSSFAGEIAGEGLKDLEIHWYWHTNTDAEDTAFGNSSVEMLYPINILVVVDDNNTYRNSDTSSKRRGEQKPEDEQTPEDEQKPDPMETGSLEGVYKRQPYVYGYTDQTFRPNNNMSRAEVSAIYARILAEFNEDAIDGVSREFGDVLRSDWFNKYIAELETSNIIVGYADGSFRPNNNITRAEFATVTVRFLESKIGKINGVASGFSDVPSTHWASEYIEKAVAKGLIKGYPDGTFKPENYISRAEVVTIINRLLVRIPDRQYIDKNADTLTIFSDVTDRTDWAYYEIYEASNEHQIKLDEQ